MAEHVAPLAESGLPADVAGTVVTVGTFDGVHRGHQDVLTRLAARGRESGLRSVLVTFDPHPSEVVKPAHAPPLLTPADEKLVALAGIGIDYCAIVPFTRTLARYDAEEFVEIVLRRRFRMRQLLVGYDHAFGRDRAGGVAMLRTLGERDGFPVEVVPPFRLGDGATVSSTAIRRAIAAGDLAWAAQALGRPYSFSARVRHGERRGRLLGYPTLNLGAPPPRKLMPPEGVYAVRVQTPSGAHGGMMNLGPRPTFGDPHTSVETHLFDAEGDWYDALVTVEFVARLRETRKFDGPEALVAQLRADAARARDALTV
jgi:riboflavin kinase/FMN adenylyltransferase